VRWIRSAIEAKYPYFSLCIFSLSLLGMVALASQTTVTPLLTYFKYAKYFVATNITAFKFTYLQILKAKLNASGSCANLHIYHCPTAHNSPLMRNQTIIII
jgi:hypothetical protein